MKTLFLASVGPAAEFLRTNLGQSNQNIATLFDKGRKFASIADGASTSILLGTVASEGRGC